MPDRPPWAPGAPWTRGAPWAHRPCNRAHRHNLFASVVIAIASNKDFFGHCHMFKCNSPPLQPLTHTSHPTASAHRPQRKPVAAHSAWRRPCASDEMGAQTQDCWGKQNKVDIFFYRLLAESWSGTSSINSSCGDVEFASVFAS